MFMRACFQNGMGSKQFADDVRVLFLQRHEELHLQYLHNILSKRGMSEFLGEQFKPFKDFNNRSDDGFHGYVPSSQLLRDIYDTYIEEHRHHVDQHMSMLSADICAIDHSHKVS